MKPLKDGVKKKKNNWETDPWRMTFKWCALGRLITQQEYELMEGESGGEE